LKFYRYGSIYHDDGPRVCLYEYNLQKETPCGWWISLNANGFLDFGEKPRWVSKTARKRYAYPAKEEALKSFKFRKIRQIKILKARLSGAEHELDIAKNMEVI